jgi:undecaprenyl-diphosphatase
MRIAGYLGNQVVLAASVLLVISWLVLGDFRKALMMALGVGGGGALFQILVHLFNRPRPVFPDPLETIHLGSFPSGHTVGTVLFYSLLLYLYLPRISSRVLKTLVVLAVVVFILVLGFSRIFLGSHYLTDVLASIALALAWGGLVYTSLELFFQGQKRRSLKS